MLKIQHVRGVILHGPPGNGKTLIARGLAKLLGPHTKLTILTATDLLSKFVGDSGKNLHNLFNNDDENDHFDEVFNNSNNDNDDNNDDDSLKKYSYMHHLHNNQSQHFRDDGELSDEMLTKMSQNMFKDEFDSKTFVAADVRSDEKYGKKLVKVRPASHHRRHTTSSSRGAYEPQEEHDDKHKRMHKDKPLHVIIIDELDSLFHRRGHSSGDRSASVVYDSVTNTLLSFLDRICTRNDILVIGLTNRLFAIDEALLRSGWFEVIL
uniref:Vesicle-fusing ATPase n=1 Tax=Lygus hesperus TaxID=30085 RepID=A0A0A9XVR8_LYGHE